MVIPIAHVSMFNGDLSFQGRSYPAADELGAFPKGVEDPVGRRNLDAQYLPASGSILVPCPRSSDAYHALPPPSQTATVPVCRDPRASPPRSPSPRSRSKTRGADTTR